jgi:hypothetical protein
VLGCASDLSITDPEAMLDDCLFRRHMITMPDDELVVYVLHHQPTTSFVVMIHDLFVAHLSSDARYLLERLSWRAR